MGDRKYTDDNQYVNDFIEEKYKRDNDIDDKKDIQERKQRFIFITGGVLSSLGKGLVSASTGCILKELGYSINLKKMDPYLNVDPGTLNPMQHGEVFVTEDGTEADVDLGNYERFTDVKMTRKNTITSGKIYQTLLERERRGLYLGSTVQVIPHVTNLIKDFLIADAEKYDFNIVEVGGTVGDIESEPFLEAIRQLAVEIGRKNVMFIHLSYVPYLGQTDEIKTKPTQHSVKRLMQSGILCDLIMCRTRTHICEKDKKKIAMFCNVDEDHVIEAPDVKNIYSLPYIYAKQGLAKAILERFKLLDNNNIDAQDGDRFKRWYDFSTKSEKNDKEIVVCVAGKYSNSNDCYKSLFEAIYHAGYKNDVKISIKWIDCRDVSNNNVAEKVNARCVEGNFNQKNNLTCDCIIIPGGFGSEGTEGKISVIKYARENNIPLLGICLGMQLSVIEFARNVCGLKNATSTEFDINAKEPVVFLMKSWECVNGSVVNRDEKSEIGGTMRLGGYISLIKERTLAYKIYNEQEILERHRHRYEINPKYIKTIEEKGGLFSAFAKVSGEQEGIKIPEIFELPDKKFFISCQFHPEFLSRPFRPHPLFVQLIKTAKEEKYK